MGTPRHYGGRLEHTVPQRSDPQWPTERVRTGEEYTPGGGRLEGRRAPGPQAG